MTVQADSAGHGRRRPPPPWVLGGAGLLALGAVLGVVPRVGLASRRGPRAASEMVRGLVEEAGTPEFWAAVRGTVTAWALGLLIAVVAGIAVGVLIGSVGVLRRGTQSTIEFLRPIPSVALIPLAVLLFGTDVRSTLLLVVYASFWQGLSQTLHGVRDLRPVGREAARSCRVSR